MVKEETNRRGDGYWQGNDAVLAALLLHAAGRENIKCPRDRKGESIPLVPIRHRMSRERRHTQGSDGPASQPRQSARGPAAHGPYVAEGGAGGTAAHVQAVPQVAAGPLAVTQRALLPVRLPRQRGLHGFAQVEGGFHQGVPGRGRVLLPSGAVLRCHGAAPRAELKQQPASAASLPPPEAEITAS